jgi:hypothetical protein
MGIGRPGDDNLAANPGRDMIDGRSMLIDPLQLMTESIQQTHFIFRSDSLLNISDERQLTMSLIAWNRNPSREFQFPSSIIDIDREQTRTCTHAKFVQSLVH